MKTSIFTKILLSCILPIGVILVMIIFNINTFISDAIRKNEMKLIENYADEMVSRIDSEFKTNKISLELVADRLAELASNQERINQAADIYENILQKLSCYAAWIILEESETQQPYFSYYTVADGKAAEEKLGREQQKMMYDERYGYPENQREAVVSEILEIKDPIRQEEEAMHYVSVPIIKDGVKIGIVGLDIWLGEELMKTELDASYENADLFLLSTDGKILCNKNGRTVNKDVKDIYQEVDLSLQQQYFLDGTLVYLMPVSLFDGQFQAVLLLDMPLGNIQKISDEMRTSIYTMSFLGLLICVMVIFFSTRNIIRPLRQISLTADTISEGDLQVGFGAGYDEVKNTKNEVVLLSKSLSKMLQQLNQFQQVKIEAISLEHEKNLAVEASNAKSSFLANMSHEIRTPMNAIIGMAEMILRCDAGKEVKEYTAYIKNAGKSLLTIINDILDFSKIEAGKMEIIPGRYQLPSLLNDIANLAQIRIGDKPVKFIVDADSSLPYELFGDEIRIKQILTNYINNAVKFTGEGSVTLCVRGMNEENGFSLNFEVRDTGIGIKKEDLEKLFASFSQVDTRRNHSMEGTGLGLAICKRLTELMGGRVGAESEYEKGSVFSAFIPQTVMNNTPIGDMWAKNNAQDTETFLIGFTAVKAEILVVDDNEVNLTVVNGLLSPYKMNITLAASAEECLDLLKEHSYNIIFMDHMMPGMDGMEATAEIRKTDTKTPIIALTANAISGVKEVYLENGFNDYLSKPIEVSSMDRVLRQYLPEDYMEKNAEGEEIKPDSALSEEILSSIYLDSRRKIPLLRKLYEERNWKDYSIEVHALKSVAATAGQSELSELARVHEMSAKGNEEGEILASFEKLIQIYQNFADSIKLPEKNTAEQTGQVVLPPEEVKEIFMGIRECAEQFDIDGIKRTAKKFQGVFLPPEEQTALIKITEAAEMLDYDEIINQISVL